VQGKAAPEIGRRIERGEIAVSVANGEVKAGEITVSVAEKSAPSSGPEHIAATAVPPVSTRYRPKTGNEIDAEGNRL
jgi:hypothetical protein